MANPPNPLEFDSFERFEMAISTFMFPFKSAADREMGRASIYRAFYESSKRSAEDVDAELAAQIAELQTTVTSLKDERDLSAQKMAQDRDTFRQFEDDLRHADEKAAANGATIEQLTQEVQSARNANPSSELLEMRNERISHLNAMLSDYKERLAEVKSTPVIVAPSAPLVENDIPDAALFQMIEPFNGSASNGIGDFDAWHGQFSLQVQHLSDRAKLKYLVLSARGDAQRTILNLDKETSGDYRKLVDVLRERYPPLHTTQQYHNMFRRASQNSSETVNEFANRLRQLVDKSKPELDKYLHRKEDLDYVVKQRFIDGTHRSIVEMLHIHNSAELVDEFSLQRVIDECRKVEHFIKSGNSSGGYTNYKSRPAEQPAQWNQRNVQNSYNSSLFNSNAPSNTGGLNNGGLPNPLARPTQPFTNQGGRNATQSGSQRNFNAPMQPRQQQMQPRQEHGNAYQSQQRLANQQPRQPYSRSSGFSQSQQTRPPPQSQQSRGQYLTNQTGKQPSYMASFESPPPSWNKKKRRSGKRRKQKTRAPMASECDQESTHDAPLDAGSTEVDSDGGPCYMAQSSTPAERFAVAPIAATRVMVEGVRVVNTMLDTGSSVNIMSFAFFHKLLDFKNIRSNAARSSFCIDPPITSLSVVGGGVKQITNAAAFKVKFPFGVEKLVEFCMLENTSVGILLGMPALRALGVKMTTPTRPDVNLIEHVSSDAVPRTPIVALHKTTVYSNSTKSIPARLDTSERRDQLCGSDPFDVQCNRMVRRFEPVLSYPNLTITPMILSNELDDGLCDVEVSSACASTVTVEKGEVVGYCSQISAVEFDTQLESSPFQFGESLTESPPGSILAQDRVKFIEENLKPFGAQLNDEEAGQLRRLILDNSHLVSLGMNDLPACNGPPMEIETGDAIPCRQKARPEPFRTQPFMNRMIKELRENRFIKQAKSPWSSPTTLAPKPKAEPGKDAFRFCVDYRWLNRLTERQAVRVPHVRELVQGLHGKRYLTTLDFKTAYWQMRLSDDASEKSTFICSLGVFQWLRMPYGLKNAPAYFIRMIESVLQRLLESYGPQSQHKSKYIGCYLDDIIVATSSFEEHISLLTELFAVLTEANLKLGISKCSFGVKETLFLGWYVSAEGKRPNPDQTIAIARLPTPKNSKDVRSFIGMVNYYREAMPNIANIAAPLHEMTKLKCIFKWSPECQIAFDKLKAILREDIVLHHPDPDKPFELFTDACDIGLAGVLEQRDDDDVSHPIGYYSHKLTPAEQRLSTNEKEANAMVSSLRYFRQYLIGTHVDVYTDHSALIPILKSPKQSHRLTKWRSELSEFDVELHFRKGKDNVNADYLSRYPICSPEHQSIRLRHGDYYVQARQELTHDIPLCAVENDVRDSTSPTSKVASEVEKLPTVSQSLLHELPFEQSDTLPSESQISPTVCPSEPNEVDKMDANPSENVCMAVDVPPLLNDDLLTHESITVAQLKCDECRELKKELAIDTASHPTLAVSGDTLLSIDLLGRGTYVTYVPVAMREAVVLQAHASPVSGHLHNPKLYDMLAKRCAWPTMRADIQHWVEKCAVCIRSYPGRHFRPELAPFVTERRFQRVVMDVVYIGPSATGVTHAVVFTCHLTRFPFVVPIVDQSASSLLEALIGHVIQYHGMPEELVADRHPTHMSDTFFQTCEAMGIRTNFSRGYTHHHAGQVERFNRSLLQMLRRSAATEIDWTLSLPWVLLDYRESAHAATGYSPAFLVYGRNLRLPIDSILAHKPTGFVDEPSRIQQIARVLDTAMRNVKHTNQEVRAQMIESYRKVNGTKPPDIAVGMLVHVMEERELLNRPNRKLYKPRYTGPFEVTKLDLPLIEIRQLDGQNLRMVHLRDVVKAKHRITPHYGTRRAPRVPRKAEPPTRDRSGRERYDLRNI